MNNRHSSFWRWFEANKDHLRSSTPPQDLIEELRKYMSKLGFHIWELGPNSNKNGTHFLMVRSRTDTTPTQSDIDFVSEAPNIPNWVFTNYLPPKKWDRKVLWGENKTFIDGSNWKFSIYKYPDGMYDVVLNTRIEDFSDRGEKNDIVYFFILSELGELVLHHRINAIDIEEFDSPPPNAVLLSEIGSCIT